MKMFIFVIVSATWLISMPSALAKTLEPSQKAVQKTDDEASKKVSEKTAKKTADNESIKKESEKIEKSESASDENLNRRCAQESLEIGNEIKTELDKTPSIRGAKIHSKIEEESAQIEKEEPAPDKEKVHLSPRAARRAARAARAEQEADKQANRAANQDLKFAESAFEEPLDRQEVSQKYETPAPPVSSLLRSSKNEAPVVVLEATVSEKQASKDVKSAEETLKEWKHERFAEKSHVKTKKELREEREAAADRQAILKVQKKLAKKGSKTNKSQYVHTSKGVVKVVFIDEHEFEKAAPPAKISAELKQAIKNRDRSPSSMDSQIEQVE